RTCSARRAPGNRCILGRGTGLRPSRRPRGAEKGCRMMRCVIAGLSVLAGWAGLAAGQTVKVDFGTGAGTPAASHAAGGLEGFWNTVGAGGGTWMSLRLLGGETSGVVLRTSALEFDVDRWDVDDGSVMADYLAARHSDATLEFAGLEAGWYRVLTYSGYS